MEPEQCVNFPKKKKQKYPSTFNFKGVEYHLEYLIHKRVLVYESGYYKFNDYANWIAFFTMIGKLKLYCINTLAFLKITVQG